MFPYESSQYCLTTEITSEPSNPAGLKKHSESPVGHCNIKEPKFIYSLIQRSNDWHHICVRGKQAGNLLDNIVCTLNIGCIRMPVREAHPLAGVIEAGESLRIKDMR